MQLNIVEPLYNANSGENFPTLYRSIKEVAVLSGFNRSEKYGQRSFENWETFPSFSWKIFGHVTRLDQSRASEKI